MRGRRARPQPRIYRGPGDRPMPAQRQPRLSAPQRRCLDMLRILAGARYSFVGIPGYMQAHAVAEHTATVELDAMALEGVVDRRGGLFYLTEHGRAKLRRHDATRET